MAEKKDYCKCTCTNDLQYSNCNKNCERVQAELEDTPSPVPPVKDEKKFNEELCEQVRKCKLAIENTNGRLVSILIKHIFPNDVEPKSPLGSYYSASNKDNNIWTDSNYLNLPTKTVTDFFASEPPVKDMEAEAREFFLPPDEGEGWNEGAETFTRKEVFNLLYTQRSMIINDIKQECDLDSQPLLLDILKNPRIPKF